MVSFSYKNAHYKINAKNIPFICEHIQSQRDTLETYGAVNPEFLSSLQPVSIATSAPSIVRKMNEAATIFGVGPMAAVAGAIAQEVGERAISNGETSVIIENGGDMYLNSNKSITVGIFGGLRKKINTLAFKITPELMPYSLCSSSGIMGHSLSFGTCDLATIFAKDAFIADCAATYLANSIRAEEDIESGIDAVLQFPQIDAAFVCLGNKIGFGGMLPTMLSHADPFIEAKISKHSASNFRYYYEHEQRI